MGIPTKFWLHEMLSLCVKVSPFVVSQQPKGNLYRQPPFSECEYHMYTDMDTSTHIG